MDPRIQVQVGDAQPTWLGLTRNHPRLVEDVRGHGYNARSVLEYSAAHQGRQGQGAQLQGQVLAGYAH
eukprot:1238945-Heterocapsa_arctica.AAC.1